MDQVAGAQVVDQVAGAQMLDQVAGAQRWWWIKWQELRS